ncbi:MAG: MBL fold metallo-hydrolase [candidate division Zixibacteria bacterium]
MNLSAVKTVSIFALAIILISGCSGSKRLEVKRQITGLETNCYLIYDIQSREAALIDVGGPIDSLLTIIHEQDLKLKYFLFTHGHADHTIGLPAIRNKFPAALVCMHRKDYKNTFVWTEWAYEYFEQETIEEWAKDPEMKKIIEFDPDSFGEPEIFVTNNQEFELGNFRIRAIHSPGHSVGSICYHINNSLFSGDVLFRGKVGNTYLLGGSPEEIVRSVRRLYTMFPDETIVYPGHNEFTTIGAEKTENDEVTIDSVSLEN